MSYQIAIDTLNLLPAPRLAHTEYCSNEAIVRRRGEEDFREWFCLDFSWSCNDGPINWGEAGRTTDMGHAEFLEGGTDKRESIHCPFDSVEEVYEFDAVEEYGMPDFDDLVDYYENWYQEAQSANPDRVVPGGYYKTVVSGAIQAFGWDMLLQAAADRDRFDRVLETIFQRSLFHYRAWAETSIEAFICHDDMVWSAGAFMHPDFYRESIVPRYRQLWAPLREAGKRVLYCSDGDFTEFLDDVAEAGADGFIFEPRMNLDTVVEKFGQTHVIMGSKVDSRTMTFGTKDDIREQVDATLPLAYSCPGFVFAVGNHIPSNVPAENVEFYINYLKDNWQRP
jgi:hypothetical protein